MTTFEKIAFGNTDQLTYIPHVGIVPARINMICEFNKLQFNTFIQIMNKSDVEYFLFAGSMIGYLRDKRHIPWTDDIDILIFEDQMDKFKKVCEKLRNNNFNVHFRKQINKVTVSQNPYGQKNFAIIDIFIAKNKKGMVRTVTGRIDCHDIPITWVRPARMIEFEGINVPVFNRYKEDIEKEYGDTNNTVIHINHFKEVDLKTDYRSIYANYYAIKEKAIKRTREKIFRDKQFVPEKEDQSNHSISDTIQMLQFIVDNNILTLHIRNHNMLKHTPSIKYYLPQVTTVLYTNVFYKDISLFLNYIDRLIVPNNTIAEQFKDLTLLSEPEIQINESTPSKITRLMTNDNAEYAFAKLGIDMLTNNPSHVFSLAKKAFKEFFEK